MIRRRKLPPMKEWESPASEKIVIENPDNILFENIESQILSRLSHMGDDFRVLISKYTRCRDINSIIRICRPHLCIEINALSDEKKVCMHCFGEIVNDIEDKSVETCENCQIVSIVPGKKIEVNREYDCSKTFGATLDHFCCIRGKRKMDVEKIRYLLDKYFVSHSMLTCAKIASLPADRKGHRGPYKIRVLYTAMKQCRLSDYYNEIYYLAHKLWGWSMPEDIINQRKVIMRHHASLEAALRSIGGHMGNQLRLYKQVQLVSDLYDEEDFIIPEADNSREEQETLWQAACEIARVRDPSMNDLLCTI